jgi:DnaJ like chaperone protein
MVLMESHLATACFMVDRAYQQVQNITQDKEAQVSIWGKMIGGAAGFALGGPIGALLGAIAGHAVDKYHRREEDDDSDENAGTRKVAFTIGAIALGAKMAKADGVVTRDEIAAFREVFHVPESEVRNVAKVWDLARQSTDGFEIYAQQIANLFPPAAPVLEQLLGSLFHIARADGVVHEAELAYLQKVAEIFGFDALAFERLCATFSGNGGDDPYSLLGVRDDASDDEIKAAHRQLVRDHHPDHLIAEGLPEELIASATAKLSAVNAAYDRIKAHRGLS